MFSLRTWFRKMSCRFNCGLFIGRKPPKVGFEKKRRWARTPEYPSLCGRAAQLCHDLVANFLHGSVRRIDPDNRPVSLEPSQLTLGESTRLLLYRGNGRFKV